MVVCTPVEVILRDRPQSAGHSQSRWKGRFVVVSPLSAQSIIRAIQADMQGTDLSGDSRELWERR